VRRCRSDGTSSLLDDLSRQDASDTFRHVAVMQPPMDDSETGRTDKSQRVAYLLNMRGRRRLQWIEFNQSVTPGSRAGFPGSNGSVNIRSTRR
jgi:hypothetical protein